MKNRFNNPYEEPENNEQLEEILRKFSEENPEVQIKMMKADTPEARKALVEGYMNMRPKHPEQIIAYETEMFGPYDQKQWTSEREFIIKSFQRGMFNKILYSYQNPGWGGAHTSIRDKKELNLNLNRIDEEFERIPDVSIKYALGMNLEIQGYDSEKQRIIIENDFRKFKGI
jgi:hypothetical protein